MRCPCCRQSLPDQASACPHCQFSLASAGHFFGQPPELDFPLTDLAGALGFWQKRAVRGALLAMAPAFPQLRFAAVLAESDARVPIGAHAFWLFNTGSLTAPQESGGLCRLVLLVLDVKHTRAACMIGYGLEPYVPAPALDRVADAAGPALDKGEPDAAIFAALDAARREFATVARAFPHGPEMPMDRKIENAGSEKAAFAY